MKGIFLLLTSLVVCFLFLHKEDEIRIRVLSNSDDPIDILYKDEVVKYLKEEILKGNRLDDKYFEENYKKINLELNEKFDNIKVNYEYHMFENKTYNGNVIKDGKYKTLLIYIGDGSGSNWWGSIYEGVITMDSKKKIKYEWYLRKGN
jgi:hypothetical protein